MNLSRRHFLKTTGLLGASTVLAACAMPMGAPAGDAGETMETTVVRFMSRSGPNLGAYQDTMSNEFRAEFPDIEVQVEPAPEGWIDLLLTQMVAGTAPDLFQAWGNIFFNWTERDLILDVQPFVDAYMSAEDIDDFNEFQWQGLEILGIRAGLPKYINLMTVTVNKDLFAELDVALPPEDGNWNHEDYAATAAQLTDAARAQGNENFWGAWYPAWNWDRFWYRIDMFGGAVVDQKYGTVCTLDTEASQAGLQWSWDRMWKDNTFAQPGQVENQWFHNVMNPGFVAMAESGTYPGPTDTNLGENFSWDMRHVPMGPTGIRKVLGTSDAWSITKQSQVPDAAWDVLNYLAGDYFQSKIVVGVEGIIPVRKSLIESFIQEVRLQRPSLENVRLETIAEILEWGYAEDSFWFKDSNAASELLVPALEKVYIVGDVGPEYLIDIAAQITEAQGV